MITKKSVYLGIFFILVISVTLGIVFAQNKAGITGNVEKNVSAMVNVSYPSTPPQIVYVSDITQKDLSANSSVNTSISFLVYSVGGITALRDDGYSARINFTNSTIGYSPVYRYNNTCVYAGVVTSYQTFGDVVNYSCNVTLWYFDDWGVNNWRINASIIDLGGNFGTNATRYAGLNALSEWEIGNKTLNWSTVVLNTNDIQADNNITVWNFGNANIMNISVNATHLNGTKANFETEQILASWFSGGNTTNSNFDLCGTVVKQMINNVYVNTPNFIDHKLSTTTVPAKRYEGLCLQQVTGISAQVYKSKGGAPWFMNAQFNA